MSAPFSKAELAQKADLANKADLPRHVAIIMDGNGRWARARHMPRAAGHVAGVSAVRGIVRASTDIGLQNLTLYAFSSENWKRPPTEVNHLMGLFRSYFRSDVDELIERNVRLRIIGNRSRAEADILEMIEDCRISGAPVLGESRRPASGGDERRAVDCGIPTAPPVSGQRGGFPRLAEELDWQPPEVRKPWDNRSR